MRLFLTTVLATALMTTGCVEDVSKGKVEAEVKTVEAPADEKAADAPADDAASKTAAGETWAVDAAASKIHALGAKITKTHDIVFNTFTGSLTVDGAKVTAINFEIDMNSLVADPKEDGINKKLTGHLKSPDFFDIDQNPTSAFASSAIVDGGEGEGITHTVTGNLTMAGKTMEVSFPAKIEMSDGTVQANAEFAIDRHQWGISYPGKPDDLIQDKVVLTIVLTARKG